MLLSPSPFDVARADLPIAIFSWLSVAAPNALYPIAIFQAPEVSASIEVVPIAMLS